jgi:uncharacterized protein YegL
MLLLDRSGSMIAPHLEAREGGDVTTTRMDALADAVKEFLTHQTNGVRGTKVGPTAEVAVGLFSGSAVEWKHVGPTENRPFTLLSDAEPVEIEVAEGEYTPLAAAVKAGVEVMNNRIAQIDQDPDLSLRYRPMIYLLTDGKPEPDGQDLVGAANMLKKYAFDNMRRPHFFFYALGIGDADDSIMRQLAPDAYFPLRGHSMQKIMRVVTATLGGDGYIAAQKLFERNMGNGRRVDDD